MTFEGFLLYLNIISDVFKSKNLKVYGKIQIDNNVLNMLFRR